MKNSRVARTWKLLDVSVFACMVALAGCSPSCSCEGMSDDAKSAPSAPTGAATGPTPEKLPSAAELNAAKQAAASASAAAALDGRSSAPPAELSQVFPDAVADKQERVVEQQRLQATQARLQTAKPAKTGALSTREALLPLLTDSVAGYRADAVVVDGPTEAGEFPVRVVSRMYKKGDTQLYVKVTDTFEAAFMRAPVLDRLTQQSSADDGYLHGRFIGGYPAIAQYYPEAKNSQVSALVGGRYVVEIRMAPAASAYEAQEVFESLPLRKLAPPDEASEAKKTK
jgi:hypothetical protein